MKSVLISIQPKWCELIASGKKTVEIRKTAPKLQTPFRCYIYCTIGKSLIFGDSKVFFTDELGFTKKYKNATQIANIHKWNGKVIGEFVCDRIEEWNTTWLYGDDVLQRETCLDDGEIMDYMDDYADRIFYLWHISDLKIYDTPKELGEFTYPCKKGKTDFNADTNCKGCEYAFKAVTSERIYCDRVIIRPPQS